MTLPKGYTPFAVYETFAPTALRGQVVLVDAPDALWRAGLPPALAMECARVGAHLAFVAENRSTYRPIADEVVAYGRPVLELARDGADGRRAASVGDLVAATLERYGRLDLVAAVGAPPDAGLAEAAAAAMAGAGGGCLVLVAPPEAEAAVLATVQRLHQAHHPHGVRSNGVLAAAVGGGEAAQQVAWLAIFFASPAGATLSGLCLQPALPAPSS